MFVLLPSQPTKLIKGSSAITFVSFDITTHFTCTISKMRTNVLAKITKLFTLNGTQSPAEELHSETMDLREEYANTFRTESYTDFWTHVLALSKGNLTAHRSVGSTSAARLPSYRLFAEHLLDPDQPTVERILDMNQTRPDVSSLLHDYFSCTSDASNLCGLLLKDIDHTRKRYKSLKDPTTPSSKTAICPNLPNVLARATLFSKSNPFRQTSPSLNHFQIVQASCSNILKGLELRRNKIRSKVRRLQKLKCGSAVFVVALTVSLTVIVATHALVLLVAAPGLMTASLDLISTEKLAVWTAQLDAAAKGTYILIRDLDTISRLVARLSNELEHMEALMQLWIERGDDRLQGSGEVACQMKKNDENFIEQLDELEEHLYLCLMTINRARNLVIKEILNSGSLNPPAR